MKYLLLVLIAMALLWACNRNKKVNDENHNEKELMENPTVQLSPSSHLFLKDLKKEIGEQSIEKYVPSADMIEKFNLIEKQGVYYVGGSLKKGGKFSEIKCEEIGIMLGTDTGPNVSCYIPIRKFGSFLNTSGVSYFKISEKAYPKN